MSKAVKLTGIREIAIAGGVSANSELRREMKKIAETNKWNLYIPSFEYCTDNAGMIAIAAYYKYLAGAFTTLDTEVSAR